MSLALETEILFRISLAIGDSMQLEPMTRRVLSETLRLLNAGGAAVYSCSGDALVPVCVLPRPFERSARFLALRACWPARRDIAAKGRMEVTLDGVTHHLIDLPGFGLMVIERIGPPLEASFLDSFLALARKLANACRACINEQEVTEQKQRLELATSAASLGVWSWNPATAVLEWDELMCSMHGIEQQAFARRLETWFDRLVPVDVERLRAGLDAALAGTRSLDEDLGVRQPDGGVRVMRVLGRATDHRLAGVALDVTTRRETNDALRRARDAAESASRAKSEFLANMSHEIRTPMNGVIGMLDLAGDSGSESELRECVAVARSSAESLLAIINDILDFSKIEAGKVEVEVVPYDLGDLLAEVVRTMSAQAGRKSLPLRIEYEPDLPRQVCGDPVRVRQVLLNLVSNAIKFTHCGSVTLRAERRVDVPGQESMSVSVIDTGIGIAPDKQSHVFEAFAQQDSSTTRSYGGTGLGLSISGGLAELMGGRIVLTSTPGEGSVFRLELPLVRGACHDRASPQAAMQPPSAAYNVLLVEDHPVNQRVAEAMLTRSGHRVSIAENGLKAVERMAEGGFDLVLMDMQMPVMGGVEATRLIREMERELGRPAVPIFAMTANALEDDRHACMTAGMNDFLTKPLLARVLDEKIAALTGGASR
ncbi:ATP-binding protein [Methyloversatilis sp.]|uniref:hybrid sensor histidine kinase/response regulator n=1 Tax=Methyloversatilis sp. TaxID=2569862 RepID=UPI0035AE2679